MLDTLMEWFNPDLRWFAVAGAIPIIIHLLHRQKYRRVRWAAMEFLLAALRKTQRRLRIENLLLLLIRILVMVLLALALARPSFPEAPLDALAESDTHHLFVIDNSTSMGYKKGQESCLDVAKRTAVKQLEELKRLTEQDKISVLLMSNYPEVWVHPTTAPKKNLVATRIGEIKLSHFGTSVFLTLQKVKELVDKSTNRETRVYLFTDFQRNAWESSDETEYKRFAELTKALTAKGNVKVYLVDVGVENADNRAIVELRVENPVVTVKRTTRFRVELHNWSSVSYPSVAVNLLVDGTFYKAEHVALPAQSSMPVYFRYEFMEPGAHYVEVHTEPDFLDVDDRRWLALDVKAGLSAVLVDGEPGNRPFTGETDYLRLVLDSSGGLFKVNRQVTPEMFEADKLEKEDFAVLANVQSLSQEKIERLERFVRGGGGLLIALGAGVDKGWYNEFLYKGGKGLLPAELEEVGGSPPEDAMRQNVRIQEYKASHPIFKTFTKGLANQPREVIFFQYFKLARVNREEVIAQYDDSLETPLWLERAYGEGRVLLWNSTLDDGWNLQVPGRVPFAVMMFNACEYLGARPGGQRNLGIGDFISLSMTADKFQKAFVLDTPGEGQVTISPAAPSQDSATFWVRYPSAPPEHPPGEAKPMENEGLRVAGLYKLDPPTPRPDERPVAFFAVNVGPRMVSPEELHRCEGNLDRISEREIRQRLPEFKFEVLGKMREGTGDVDLKPPASGLWKYLLYFLMIFLVTESVLAWLFGKAKQ